MKKYVIKFRVVNIKSGAQGQIDFLREFDTEEEAQQYIESSDPADNIMVHYAILKTYTFQPKR